MGTLDWREEKNKDNRIKKDGERHQASHMARVYEEKQPMRSPQVTKEYFKRVSVII